MAFSNPERFQKWLIEHLIIFFSIIRWTVLSTITGILVGGSVALFIKILDLSILFHRDTDYYFLLLPLGLLLSTFLIEKFAKDAEGHGTEKVIEAIHKKTVKSSLKLYPLNSWPL